MSEGERQVWATTYALARLEMSATAAATHASIEVSMLRTVTSVTLPGVDATEMVREMSPLPEVDPGLKKDLEFQDRVNPKCTTCNHRRAYHRSPEEAKEGEKVLPDQPYWLCAWPVSMTSSAPCSCTGYVDPTDVK